MQGKSINYIVFGLLIPAIGLVVYMNWCGLGYTTDSHNYLMYGRLIAQQGIIAFIQSDHISYQPPLYFILVALIGAANMKIFNVICFLLLLAFSWLLIKNEFKNKLLTCLTILVIGYGTPLYLTTHFLWTELPFLLLSVVLFYTCRCLKKTTLKWIIIFTASGLLLLLRHAGLFLIIGLFINLFIDKPHVKNFTFCLYMFLLCLVPTVIWHLLRPGDFLIWFNYAAEVKIQNQPPLHWISYGNWFSKWLLPEIVPQFIRLLVTLAALGTPVLFIRQKNIRFYYIIVIFYLSGLLFITTVLYQGDEERLLSPAYIPFILTLFLTISRFFVTKKSFKYGVLSGLIIIWCLYPVVRTIKNVAFWHIAQCRTENNGQ